MMTFHEGLHIVKRMTEIEKALAGELLKNPLDIDFNRVENLAAAIVSLAQKFKKEA